MELYKIIKSLQSAAGSNTKIDILEANKDDELLRAYLKATYDPAISYYISKCPKPIYKGSCNFTTDILEGVKYHLADRNISGKQAISWLQYLVNNQVAEGQELLSLMISRSVGAGVGETLILKVWPKLFFVPPYMRCSLMTPKIKKHFESLDEIIVQKKADGSFCYIVEPLEGPPKAFTRAGSHYPAWLVARLLNGVSERNKGYVFVGELLVYVGGFLLDRQTGNGIYNSILKGAEEDSFDEYTFIMEAWDLLPEEDFKIGLCKIPYYDRLSKLQNTRVDYNCIEAIETTTVKTLEEAYKTYSEHTSNGFEGAVIKDGMSPWKDHTSPLNVKLKIAFEAEYVITGTFEGQGKYVNMLGGFYIETSDGLMKSSVGTGFPDSLRKDYWKIPSDGWKETICTVIANDVIGKRGSDIKSLFLPVFSELRLDKNQADSLGRVMEQLSAAKGLL